ncbi:MAG: polymer-forming cytoskeletal protein [Methylococcales bacterium]
MFKKSHANNGLLGNDNILTSSKTVPSSSPSVLGPTLRIKGELFADEDLVIEGQVEGSIRHNQQHITIGRQGRVKGDIAANVITIEGFVEGNIHGADAVMIKKTSKVEGDIRSRRIVIDDGAQFNGRIDMDNEPETLAINLGGGNELDIDNHSSIDDDLGLESLTDTNDIVELDASVQQKKIEKVSD